MILYKCLPPSDHPKRTRKPGIPKFPIVFEKLSQWAESAEPILALAHLKWNGKISQESSEFPLGSILRGRVVHIVSGLNLFLTN